MTALNLVVIRSVDPEQSRLFYEAIGVRFSVERHGNGPEHLTADLDGVVFEIYPRGTGSASTGTRIGFRVHSVADAVAVAERINATVVSPPKTGPWGLRAVIEDPDGHRVEISE